MYKQLRIKKLISNTLLLSFLLSIFLIPSIVFGQYNIPKKPNFIPPVIDSTKTLSKVEYKKLYDKLKNYSDSTSTEVILVIIPTTKGENIGLLAPRWGHKWGIGQAKEDNGVFVLLAKHDRKIWIAPGYGVEHKLTAGITGELIRNVIIPEFKKGDYYSGLDKGTDAIFKVLNGTYKGSRKSNSGFPAGAIIVIAFFVFFFIVILIAISKGSRGGKGGSGGKRSGGLDIWDAIILSNMGRGSTGGSSGWGGFGGGSSGGFGGFGGGGGFSGGGAGGSW